MASLIPISTYNLALKPFQPVPAIEDEYPITIRLTLAAVDPEAVDDKEEPSTLRLLKRTNPFVDDEEDDFDEDDEEDELDDEEDDEEEEEEQPKKAKKSNKQEEEEEEDSDEEDLDLEGSDEDEDDEEGVSEFVVCTLSPKVAFQQTIDLTISPDEEVYFVVTGSYPIHLTGNYVEHPADEDSEDDEYDSEEYDMSPDEDEIVHGNGYDLDDLEDESDIENKIQELVEEEISKKRGAEEVTPKESKKAKKEAEKKSVQFTKELEQGPTGSTLVEQKDSKKESKKEKAKAKKEEAKSKKEEAQKEKESAKEAASKDKKYSTKTLLGGVVTEDRKVGSGQQAKTNHKVGIRYIGKLKNGKTFDKNTSGKPFVFTLGKGECIKGFDLGVAGMSVGGERRVIIPAKMGYGSQALPGIPANSELTFDIKLVSLK